MRKLEKYTGTKTYMFPNGTIATPGIVKSKYPAITLFPHVVETDEGGQVFMALENLSMMKSLHGLDASMSEEEAIKALEEIINAPAPEPEIDATERIAAALELNNLINM